MADPSAQGKKSSKGVTAQAFNLFASAQDKQRLNTVLDGQKLPDLAEKNVIFLTRDALLAKGSPFEKLADAQDWFTWTTERLDNGIHDFLTKNLGMPERDVAGKMADEESKDMLRRFFGNALNGELGDSYNLPDGKTALITVNLDSSAHATAALLSGLPENLLGNIADISGHDWLAIATAHEAAHTRKYHADPGAPEPKTYLDSWVKTEEQENGADVASLSRYFNQRARSAALGANAPAEFAAMRAIGSLRQSGDFLNGLVAVSNHATSNSFDIRESSVTPAAAWGGPQTAAAILTINTQANMLLGALAGASHPQETASAQKMLNSLQDRIAEEDKNPPPDGQPRSDSGWRALLATTGGPRTAETLLTGANIANNDPLLQYAAIKAACDLQVFEKGSPEEVIARKYIAAFERHVPSSRTSLDVQNFLIAASNDGYRIERMYLAAQQKPDVFLNIMANGRDAILRPAPEAAQLPQPAQAAPGSFARSGPLGG